MVQNVGGDSFTQFLLALSSKEFLDRIATKWSYLSYTVVGGGQLGIKDEISRSRGKSRIEKIIQDIFSGDDNKSEKATTELLSLFTGINLNDKSMEKFRVDLLDIFSEVVVADLRDIGLTKEGKIRSGASNESEIKRVIKIIGKRFMEEIKKQYTDNFSKMPEIINNMAKGHFIPSGSSFAMDIEEYGQTGEFTTRLEAVFYSSAGEKKQIDYKDKKQREQISKEIVDILYDLFTENLDNIKNCPEALTWLKGHKVFFKRTLTKVLVTSGENVEEILRWDRPGISGVLGLLQSILLTSSANKDNKWIAQITGTQLNKLGQQGITDLQFLVGKDSFGLQIKNYTSKKSSINLYGSSSGFNLFNDTAQKYFEPQLLACLRYLIGNRMFLQEGELNLKTLSDEELQIVILQALPQFTRIYDMSEVSEEISNYTTDGNSFYLLNGRFFSSSRILGTIYVQLKKIFDRAEKDLRKNIDKIVELNISGNLEPQVINDEDIPTITKNGKTYKTGYQKMKDNFWGNTSHNIAITAFGHLNPQAWSMVGRDINANIRYKGLTIRLK